MVCKYMSLVQRIPRSLYLNTKSNIISTVIKVRHKGKKLKTTWTRTNILTVYEHFKQKWSTILPISTKRLDLTVSTMLSICYWNSSNDEVCFVFHLLCLTPLSTIFHYIVAVRFYFRTSCNFTHWLYIFSLNCSCLCCVI
jgi:hypothetical protein